MLTRAWLCTVVLSLSGLVCWPAESWADEKSEGALSAAAEEGAESAGDLAEALRQAVEAYDQGDLATARRQFELVHAHAPTARTLRSLGLVAFREQRYADAIALLEAGLASQVKPLTESQREGAAAVLREARSKLPPDSAPLVSAPVVPRPVVSAQLVPAETPEAPAPVAGPTRAAKAPARAITSSKAASSEALRGRRFRRAGYALLGVAAAALVTSVTSYQVGLARLHRIENKCRPDPGCELDYVQKRERSAHLDALGNLSLVSGIVAGVTGGAGTAFLVWRWRADRNTAAQAELGLGWRGVF